MFKPDKWKVLHRWAFNLGPQLTVAHMLSHIGDVEIFRAFMPGDEPTWLEATAVLLAHNEQFTVEQVVAELERRSQMPPIKLARRNRA